MLVNTGWTGGGYGTGERMKLEYTRAMVRAALAGQLDEVDVKTEPVFGLSIPVACPDVPPEVLDPSSTWTDGEAYDAKAQELAERFRSNFEQYEKDVDKAVLGSGPEG